MCELKIIINKEVTFENAIYAKADKNNVYVKNVLGSSKIYENYAITEVNIPKEQLTLTPIETI